MKKNINNEKGFTLIELLAVIVVLAIVSVVAVNAVMPRLAEGRRQSFATEANVAIDSANAYFMAQSVLGGGKGLPTDENSTACVSIKDLIDNGYFDADVKTYEGKVQVTKKGNLYLYKIWLKNDSLMVIDQGSDGTNNVNITSSTDMVKDLNSTQFVAGFKTCSATPAA